MVRILFDNSHNEYLTARKGPIRPCQASEPRFNWVPLINKLVEKGFEVFSLEAGPISDEILKECDIFVLGQPESCYAHSKGYLKDSLRTARQWGFLEEQEIKSILAFVERGGGLFVIEEYGGEFLFTEKRNNLNELSKYFGIEFNKDTVVGEKYMGESQNHVFITAFDPSHPVTEGITKLVYLMGCSINVELPAKPLAFTGPKDLPRNSCVLAVCEYKRGRVVAMGDGTLFSEQGINLKQNGIGEQIERLSFNIFHWLSPPDWVSSPSIHNVGVESLMRTSNEETLAVKKKLSDTTENLDLIRERIVHIEKRLNVLGAPKKVGLLSAAIKVSFEVALILLGFSLAAFVASITTGTSIIPLLDNALICGLLLAVVLLIGVVEVFYERR
jgi:hypothetical protein